MLESCIWQCLNNVVYNKECWIDEQMMPIWPMLGDSMAQGSGIEILQINPMSCALRLVPFAITLKRLVAGTYPPISLHQDFSLTLSTAEHYGADLAD